MVILANCIFGQAFYQGVYRYMCLKFKFHLWVSDSKMMKENKLVTKVFIYFDWTLALHFGHHPIFPILVVQCPDCFTDLQMCLMRCSHAAFFSDIWFCIRYFCPCQLMHGLSRPSKKNGLIHFLENIMWYRANIQSIVHIHNKGATLSVMRR